MTLDAGTKLGRYEIRSKLGEGGMGEVYLAQDSKLDRTVAIKVLPADLAHDQSRMRRFVQEARTASSLSHPNVAHIYEIEEIDGVHFIAMEHVNGATLRERIAGGGLNLNEVLDIAVQIAAALSAAHSAGITHRDVKPDNIMLRQDGYVKVLDFGLAKLSDLPSDTDTEAPTKAMVNTDPGTVMGTVGYMSPEQARGKAVDARTDIWSLGVVIYQMVTNHLPFEGSSNSDVIAAILGEEPAPMARYAREIPEALEWITTKALTKDPDERYQTAKEMMVDLRRIKQRLDAHAEIERSSAPNSTGAASGLRTGTTGTGESVAVSASRGSSSTSGSVSTAAAVSSAEYLVSEIKRHKTGLGLIVGLLLIGLVGGGPWIYKLSTANKTSGTPAIKFTRLTTGGKIGSEIIGGGAAISPDGKYVSFWTSAEGKSSLFLRQVSTNSLIKIAGPLDGDYGGSTFSPDGEHIYFAGNEKNDSEGSLFRVSTLGGTPQRILRGTSSPVTFSPDGKQIAYVRLAPATGESFLLATSDDGSETPRTLATRKLPDYFSSDGPSWSPDGRVIAVGAASVSAGNTSSTIVEVPATGGKERPISTPQWNYVSRVMWLHDGSGLVMTIYSSYNSLGTQIWFVSYPDGVARRITNDLNGYGEQSLGLTVDGKTIVTVQDDFTRTIWAVNPNDAGTQPRQVSNGKYEGAASISAAPDDRIVYLDPTGEANEIWIMKSDGSEKKQLTSDGFLKDTATVSPDGRYIVFSSYRSGTFSIWRMDIDGNNQKQLTQESTFATGPVCSTDSKWVIFQSFQSDNWYIKKVSIDGGAATPISDTVCASPDISPDGKSIACVSIQSTIFKQKLAILPFDGNQAPRLIDMPATFKFNSGVKWSPNGREITYVEDSGGFRNLAAISIDSGASRALARFKSDRITRFAWSGDGKQIFLGRGSNVTDVVLIKDFR